MELTDSSALASAFELCLGDLKITNLTEPVLKYIQFKAKCSVDRLKDNLKWEDYCLKNNIKLTNVPKIIKHTTTVTVPTQTETFAKPKTREQTKPELKSVSIQTLNMKNKTVQVKMKDLRHKSRTKQPEIKKEIVVKPRVKADVLRVSPTMLKLENQVLDNLINDVKFEMERIEWKNKVDEMNTKRKKLKAVRKQIRKLESEESSSSCTLSLSHSQESSSKSCKPLCLTLPEDKLKQIMSHNSKICETKLKIPGIKLELLDRLADNLLQETLQSVTQEVVEIVDYIATVSYQEEVEFF